MDDITKLMINKLEKIDSSLSRIDITLAKQEEQIRIHVKRTNLLEAKLVPVEKHVLMVHAALKLIGILGIFVGILEGIIKILGG